jgi:hypothetical protein
MCCCCFSEKSTVERNILRSIFQSPVVCCLYYMSFYICVVCRSVSCVRVPRYRGALSLFSLDETMFIAEGFLFFFAMPIYIFILHPLHHYFFFFRRCKHKMYTPPFFSFITSTAKFWLERIYRPFCPQGVTVKSTSGITLRNMFQNKSRPSRIYTVHLNLFFFLFSLSCGIFESNLKKHTKKDSRGRCIFLKKKEIPELSCAG